MSLLLALTGTVPPVPPPFAGSGGGSPSGAAAPTEERDPHERWRLDREELRAMLEAAFSDAPRDPVLVEIKQEFQAPKRTERTAPRVDWKPLLRDLDACQRILEQYAQNLTKPRPARRPDPRYSHDSVLAELARVQAAARERKRRAALALLMH